MIGATVMIALALALAGEAAAKEFDRLVVVGDQGRWIALEPRPGVIDLLFEGGGERPASGGYLRLFPLFRGYPGLPSRYYPATGAVCATLREPARLRTCPELDSRLAGLLREATGLPRFHRPPTVPATVRYRGRSVRFGNLNTGLELALDRRGRPAAIPGLCLSLTVTWRGPLAGQRPGRLDLCPDGVYVGGRRYPLGRSLFAWARLNLRGAKTPVYGSRGRDVLRGTQQRDGLRGRGGGDRLLGFAGNDNLYGEDGDDVLFGHVGNDRFFGGRGRDLVYAGPGRDWADGGLGNDRLLGAASDDILFGGPGNDHLSGGPGADRLFGNAGDDFIDARDSGGAARRLPADCRNCEPIPAGAEYVSGGGGGDRILARDGQRDFITCDSGFDVVVADRGDRFPFRDEPAACELVLGRFDRRGISFVYPATWFVTTKPLSKMRDPDYRFAVATWPVTPASGDRGPCLPGIASQRPADGALAFLGESIGVSRKQALRRLPVRPRHFRLPTQRDGDFFCLGRGSILYQFKDSGRAHTRHQHRAECERGHSESALAAPGRDERQATQPLKARWEGGVLLNVVRDRDAHDPAARATCPRWTSTGVSLV